MKHLIKYGWIFLLCLSCTESFNVRTDNSPQITVIYSEITDEVKTQSVRVSRSSPYFADEPNVGVSAATVTISSSEGDVYEFAEDTVAGNYLSLNPWAAKAGVDYFLKVEVFDNEGNKTLYEAETSIIPVGETAYLDSIVLAPIAVMGHENYALYVFGQDAPTQDFYLIRTFVNDSLTNPHLSQYLIIDDVVFNGEYIQGLLLAYFDNISERENDSEERRKRSIYLQPGDRVDVKMSLIPEGFFYFVYQCTQEMSGENPIFGGPPSNITTNISNGAAGYFTGYCEVKGSTVVK